MLEAVILSVTPAYLESLKKTKPKIYKKVSGLKQDIEKPLASILTFNTIAHTVGAAGAGAEAQRIYGSEILAIFSAALTFVILFFSEIIPKSIGAGSWRTLLPIAAQLLAPMVIIAYPIVWMSEKISHLFKKESKRISREEIIAMADIGLNYGTLKTSEHRSLTSIVKFEKVQAKDILTPAAQVETLQENLDIEAAYAKLQTHTFSRIPVTDSTKKRITGYILRNQILDAKIKNNVEKVSQLQLPILNLPETIALPQLFQNLLHRREHMCAIINHTQEFIGIISLEDLIEHMLDLEIYDEQDE